MTVAAKRGALAGAVALIALAIGLSVWWTHPSLPEEQGGNSFSAGPRPVVAAHLTVPVTWSPIAGRPEVVDVSGARAHFMDNSAAATVTFWICQNHDGGLISAHDLHGACRHLRPLTKNSNVIWAPGVRGEFVVMTLQPRRPGHVRVDRVDLDFGYRYGPLHRSGTAHITMDVGLRAT